MEALLLNRLLAPAPTRGPFITASCRQCKAGVIDLDEVVQDGVRVRASAGAASFHRAKTLGRERRAKTNKAEVARRAAPRASSTDPEARVMKMADGGFRPAYNCQLGTVAGGQIVVGLDVETSGSDRGLLPAMIEQLERRYGRRPKRHLVDGGFNKNADTEWAAGKGVKLYGPSGQTKQKNRPLRRTPQGRSRRRRRGGARYGSDRN